MPWDPYAPPTAAPDPPSIATTRLFGPVTIALVTALLNPVFGVILAAVNHQRLRDHAAVRRTYREHAPLVARHVAAGGRKARGYLIVPGCVVLTLIGLAIWQFLSP